MNIGLPLYSSVEELHTTQLARDSGRCRVLESPGQQGPPKLKQSNAPCKYVEQRVLHPSNIKKKSGGRSPAAGEILCKSLLPHWMRGRPISETAKPQEMTMGPNHVIVYHRTSKPLGNFLPFLLSFFLSFFFLFFFSNWSSELRFKVVSLLCPPILLNT